MQQIAFVPNAGARRRAAAFVAAASPTASLSVTPGASAWQPGKDGSSAIAANTTYIPFPEVRITTLASAATECPSRVAEFQHP